MEQLFNAIPAVLKGLGPNAGIDGAVVFAAWTRCAGEPLRTRTAPLEFFENRLVVAVEDKTWQRHLQDLSPQMLVKLNDGLGQGTVKFIEFRIGVSAVKAARGESHAIAAEQTLHEVKPALAKAAEAIADEDLRKQFLSAAASYLKKQRQD